MISSSVLVHSVCTILSNYGETLAFAELATAGLLQRQFRHHPLCHKVLREPSHDFDLYAPTSSKQLAIDAARSASSHWAMCTVPLVNQGMEITVAGHGVISAQYKIIHPPHLPVQWPPWTACYEIIERFATFLTTKSAE
ncbi:MAG: hypothetical protein DI535_19730 [Citrobacter freundii]|nr:MAG: hypothetical protein DI535_19730 [Citrobacter freundii]